MLLCCYNKSNLVALQWLLHLIYTGINGLDTADADDTDISNCSVSDYAGRDCSSPSPQYPRKTCKCTVAARDGNQEEGIWKKFKLQEGAGRMTVLEAAGNIYCAAVMASTLLPHVSNCTGLMLRLIQVQKKCT